MSDVHRKVLHYLDRTNVLKIMRWVSSLENRVNLLLNFETYISTLVNMYTKNLAVETFECAVGLYIE